ncbi:MAG: S1C family serine protease [Planctomycetota bacterium]
MQRLPAAGTTPARIAAFALAIALLLLPGLPAPDSRAQDGAGAHALQKTDQRNASVAATVSKSVVAVVPIGTALGDWYSVAGGAGFVIDTNGHVLTALINVGSSSRVNVVIPGGKMVRAEVVGRDERNGCALLKVDREAASVPPLTFANSESLSIGATTYTFGNPFSSVVNDDQIAFSSGTLSGRYRPTVKESGDERESRVGLYAGPVLETTCAINDGNFGGPLTDRHGHVIGLVVKLISYQRWLGCAVPINQIAFALPRLKAGQAPLANDPGLSSETVPGEPGAKLNAIVEGGAAAKAGLAVGDVVLKVDSETVADNAALSRILEALPAGARLNLQVKSGDQTRFVAITLAAKRE